MKLKSMITLYVFLFLEYSCDQPRLNFDRGYIPMEVVNLQEVNTAFDDYNSSGYFSEKSRKFDLIFSTNRNSEGNDFDFIGYKCSLYANQITGEFGISSRISEPNSYISLLNTEYNELGPFYDGDLSENIDFGDISKSIRLFLTSDRDGDLDIFLLNLNPDPETGIYTHAGEPVKTGALNTPFNEGYICTGPGDTVQECVYFNSDRDGNYNIYMAVSNSGLPIEKCIDPVISAVETLNSKSNDKCPFVAGNIMVFTSDRPGGYGGFDLFFSEYTGTGWTHPQNLGAGINSEFNEYRPFILATDREQFINDLLIFSSDRPGGQGGYDLYYSGTIFSHYLIID